MQHVCVHVCSDVSVVSASSLVRQHFHNTEKEEQIPAVLLNKSNKLNILHKMS